MSSRFTPYYNSYCRIFSENSRIDPESAVLHDTSYLSSFVTSIDSPHGLFNDKHKLHVIPHPTKSNVFVNRISYDIRSDAYYENGIKYIEFWDRGAYSFENLIYVYDYSEDRTNYKDRMSLYPNNLGTYPSIIYKFDYSSCESLEITSLSLKLNCADDNFDCNWKISISTNFDLKDRVWVNVDERINLRKLHNLTRYVSHKKVFYIKFEIKISERSNFERNINLFPQTRNFSESEEEYNVKDNFELDIIVEFSPLKYKVISKMLHLNMISKELLKTSTERVIPTRSLDSINNTVGGLFNDKYAFNVLPYENNLYTHRISYDAYNNAYYENGNAVTKYLKRWNRGAFTHENIYYFTEFSRGRRSVIVSRTLGLHRKTLPAYITWKFDYRPGNFYLTSLELIIKFHHSTNINGVQWFIQALSTGRNPNPKFIPIGFPLENNRLDYNLDLTRMVEDKCGFILKAYIKKKKTSDFTIKLISSDESEREFYVHSSILASGSDYFNAMLNSKMTEFQNKRLDLVDISYLILEKILLYIYTHNLDYNLEFVELVDLLYAASRFFVLRLIQLCEILIRKFVNHENVEEILEIAKKCGAFQLVKYCENFEVVSEPIRPVKKFKGVLTSLARKMKRL
ncbi:3822_t:CDS:2 [Funneliformis mosseae]|uniref:3822_t:CDS:1 n=1 Tax=Funneliformis mosseae TaxID=27381 RepID=A0A9N9FED6_FUNMO|nr:3822_t:CDS:2 [Funneliformis mosseae]